MTTMNLRELNQRLIADEINSTRVAEEYATRRKEVEKALLHAYEELGAKSLVVTLPGAGEVATVTLKQGAVVLDVDEDVLLRVVEDRQPDEIEEVIDPTVLEDPDVLALLREHRPDAFTRRVRPVWRDAKLREAKTNSGRITLDTGETVKIGQVTWHEPTGAFQLTYSANGGRERAAAALAHEAASEDTASEDTAVTASQPEPTPEKAGEKPQDKSHAKAPAKTTRKRATAGAR